MAIAHMLPLHWPPHAIQLMPAVKKIKIISLRVIIITLKPTVYATKCYPKPRRKKTVG